MNRFERRKYFLQGKREGAFSSEQYYLERAVRGTVSRKLRTLLRSGVPVVLYTPRWSESQRFLADLIPDLEIGEPQIQARTFSLQPLHGRNAHDTRRWLMQGLMEFFGQHLEGPAVQAVGPAGFRTMVREVLEAANHGQARALLMHGVEHMNVEVRQDLAEVFRAFAKATGLGRRVNFVFAGALEAGSFELDMARHLTLVDYAEEEATSALAELGVERPEEELAQAVRLVGGVPTLLDVVGRHAMETGVLVQRMDELWRVLGPVSDELRAAVSILHADDRLAERLEVVAARGQVRPDPELDLPLRRAGVLQERGLGSERSVVLRSQVFCQLMRGH
ncbi:MAG: hypothetical protein JXX28_17385 [Deltaproteobacteria bacterium]|nr:hypothetical protein [Deltaproteobacteria bacterium]